MTDGTSQGLFIVVAIVIFGIFVVLAYILFEDTLSPALASMFSDATERAESRINKEYIPEIYGDYEFIKETGTLTKYLGTSSNVSIPSEIDGVVVRIIGQYAFNHEENLGKSVHVTQTALSSVSIPNSVKEIGYKSFNENNLVSLTIPDSVVIIKQEAFQRNQLSSLTLSKNLRVIEKEAFEANKLTSVELPNTLERIEYGVFATNWNLATVNFPDSLKIVGERSFFNTKVLDVKLREGVEIGNRAFPDAAVITYK